MKDATTLNCTMTSVEKIISCGREHWWDSCAIDEARVPKFTALAGIALTVFLNLANVFIITNATAGHQISISPDVLCVRGNYIRQGYIDSEGNFIPRQGELGIEGIFSKSGRPEFPFNSINGRFLALEYRSGTALPGTVVPYSHEPFKSTWCIFIPEIGGTIREFVVAVKEDKSDRLYYNQHHHDFWTKERMAKYPNGLPKTPVPPKMSVPAGYRLVPFSEAIPPLRRPRIVRIIGQVAEIGSLHETGEFVPDYSLAPFQWKGVDKSEVKLDIDVPPHLYTLPLNGKKTEPCYEFRSGRLIKGTLHDTGNFAPEVGSKILDFKDYDPKSDKRRIYNLPGELRPKK